MSKKQPKVSIIVTCYNLGKYLDDSIQSAIDQTYKNIEIILVNDGSDDRATLEKINKWCATGIVFLLNLDNGGVARARNKGIEVSKGEYICCLDADDILAPEYIEKCVDIFEKARRFDKLAVVSTWVQRFGSENTIWKTGSSNPEDLLLSNHLHCASLFNRDAFDKVGGYDENLKGYEDWELWISFFANGYSMHIIEEPIFKYRVRPNSKVGKSNRKRIEILEYIISKHSDLYSDLCPKLLLNLEQRRLNLELFESNAQKEATYFKGLENEIEEIGIRNRMFKNELESIKKSKFYLLRDFTYRARVLIKKIIYALKKDFKLMFKYILFLVNFHLLPKGGFKLISADVFDTLLRRLVYPEEIKLATAVFIQLNYIEFLKKKYSKWEIYEKRLEIEKSFFEKGEEYELSIVLKTLLSDISRDGVDIKDILDIVIEYELGLEEKVLYKDPNIEKIFTKIAPKAEIYFLSDFYIKGTWVKEMVQKYFPKIEGGKVSCDVNKTKRDGSLFEELPSLSKEGIIHVGDNKHSDYNMPKKHGISSLQFFDYSEECKREANQKSWQMRKAIFPYGQEIDNLLRKIPRKGEFENPKAEEMYALGVKYAPIFYSFVLNSIELASKKGIGKIYYLTREGVFFSKIHTEINKVRRYFKVKPDLLEVSRLSTFYPSVKDFSPDSFERLWIQYKEQSPRAFFKSLGVDIDTFSDLTEKYSVAIDEPRKLAESEEFRSFMKEPRVKVEMEKILEEKKEFLLSYLSQKGLTNECGKSFLVVDIGWRGSIQDNLGFLLDKALIYGNYLGLHSSYYITPPNVFKSAYGPNYLIDNSKDLDIVNWTGVWEMLTNSPMGSIMGYCSKNGMVEAVEGKNRGEVKVYEDYISYFQAGVMDSISELDNFVEVHGLTSDEFRPYIISLMSNLVYKPEYIITEAYFSLKHNETFGLGQFVDMSALSDLKTWNIFKILISSTYRKRFYNDAVKSCWRNGYWTFNGINYFMQKMVSLRYILTGKL